MPETGRIIPVRYIAILLGVFGLASIALFLLRHSSLPALHAFLSITVIWLGILPTILFLLRPLTKQTCLPLMALTGMFYSVFFGLSGYFVHMLQNVGEDLSEFKNQAQRIRVYDLIVDQPISLEALAMVLVGLALMYFGYYGLGKFLWQNLPRFTFSHKINHKIFLCSIYVLLAMYVGYWYVSSIRLIPSVSQIVQPIGYICFGYFYVVWKSGNLSRIQTIIVFFILFPLVGYKLIATGLITPILLFFVFYIVLTFWLSRTLPWIKVCSAILLVVMLYPFLPTIRGKIWFPDNQKPVTEMLAFQAKKLIEKYPQSESELLTPGVGELCQSAIAVAPTRNCSAKIAVENAGFRGLAQRLAHISVLTVVIKKSPDPIPFLEGESYKPLLTSVIPRLLWPDKPEERFGNDFGRRYGFIPPQDKATSINIPWITEMYVNFGLPGILLGMFTVGLLISGIEKILLNSEMAAYEQVVGAAIVFPLFYQDSNFSLMTGSLPLIVLVLWIYFWLFPKLLIPWLK